jgi:hypothetical protein
MPAIIATSLQRANRYTQPAKPQLPGLALRDNLPALPKSRRQHRPIHQFGDRRLVL